MNDPIYELWVAISFYKYFICIWNKLKSYFHLRSWTPTQWFKGNHQPFMTVSHSPTCLTLMTLTKTTINSDKLPITLSRQKMPIMNFFATVWTLQKIVEMLPSKLIPNLGSGISVNSPMIMLRFQKNKNQENMGIMWKRLLDWLQCRTTP